ncbi:MAG: hypothetical protein OJF50_004876 [Nitrospira sp.]|jgi:hypothetical protein|nr:hypothetical protein [Nitrospira sp.]
MCGTRRNRHDIIEVIKLRKLFAYSADDRQGEEQPWTAKPSHGNCRQAVVEVDTGAAVIQNNAWGESFSGG